MKDIKVATGEGRTVPGQDPQEMDHKVASSPLGGVDLEEGQVKSSGWMEEKWWERGVYEDSLEAG